jgi:hypothetical protein
MTEDMSVGDAIKKIQGGEISGKDLPKELLRETIQVLRNKGQEQNVIAKFLGYSDRQIRRLLKDIRKANRFKYSEDTHTEHVGWFVMSAQSQIDFLTRTYNNASCSEKEKILACIGAWKVAKELTESLQSLGVLPSSQRLINFSSLYEEKGKGFFGNPKTEVYPGTEGFDDLSPIDRTNVIKKMTNCVTDEIARLKAEMLRRQALELPPAAQ